MNNKSEVGVGVGYLGVRPLELVFLGIEGGAEFRVERTLSGRPKEGVMRVREGVKGVWVSII